MTDASVDAVSTADEEITVDAILAAFETTPVVALGEQHGSTAQHALITDLVEDPRFPDLVDDVVVEFANSRLQPVLDRYVDGEDVPTDELASVWRESTQRSGVWEHPVYLRFFQTVRAVNTSLEPSDRIRVLAGDSPVDWSTITATVDCNAVSTSCLDHWLMRREADFAAVVEREVLSRGRTALLIAGSGHVTRRAGQDEPPSITQRIELAHPGAVTVFVLDGP